MQNHQIRYFKATIMAEDLIHILYRYISRVSFKWFLQSHPFVGNPVYNIDH